MRVRKKSGGGDWRMVGIAGLLSVMVGAIVAYLSDRFPARIEVLETLAGIMVIAGFALAGYSMPTII
jgi:uncharacterized membrane protein YjjP (DUF1212 family)